MYRCSSQSSKRKFRKNRKRKESEAEKDSKAEETNNDKECVEK